MSARIVAVGGLVGALVSGCYMQAPRCPVLDGCGGPPPIGSWELDPGHPSCSEDLYVPPTDTRLVMADLPPARTPPPEPALFDWCMLLVTGPGANIQVRPPRFYYEDGPVGVAAVKYEVPPAGSRIGRFSAGITRTGHYFLDFPAFCMRAFGGMEKPVDPDDPSKGLSNVCQQLQGPLAESGLGEGSYRNTTCKRSPVEPGGCLCEFDVTETGGPSGSYQILDDQTILHLPGTNFPQRATYCTKGNTLELTGANGAYLFDVPGLRTMKMVKATSMP